MLSGRAPAVEGPGRRFPRPALFQPQLRAARRSKQDKGPSSASCSPAAPLRCLPDSCSCMSLSLSLLGCYLPSKRPWWKKSRRRGHSDAKRTQASPSGPVQTGDPARPLLRTRKPRPLALPQTAAPNSNYTAAPLLAAEALHSPPSLTKRNERSFRGREKKRRSHGWKEKGRRGDTKEGKSKRRVESRRGTLGGREREGKG